MILAGDVGGTKTALALFDDADAALTPLRELVAPSRSVDRFETLLARFLAPGPPGDIVAACFGVPGPVVGGRCVATNLPWTLDEAALAAAIPAGRVRLLNDLEATAHGVLGLPAGALAPLQAGRPQPGNMAVIAAGTGLGQALLVRDGDRYVTVASEGGHADFAPRTELQWELLRFLGKELGHVSAERVLSGAGLVAIYRFLRAGSGLPEPAWRRERIATGDPAAAVSGAALAGEDPVAGQALEVFCDAYGAEAGNLALKGLALGGVFVAGGIAPRIRAALAGGRFVRAFTDKGRLAGLMAAIPVHLVLELRAPLLGAARVARALAGRDASVRR